MCFLGLDLTKYLAYLSLCTMSSHLPLFFSPSHIRSDDSAPASPTFSLYCTFLPTGGDSSLATLISFEFARACTTLHSPLHTQMSRNEVYISHSFLFPYIKLLYPPVRRQRWLLIYCNVHKKDMTQFFFLSSSPSNSFICGFREKKTISDVCEGSDKC